MSATPSDELAADIRDGLDRAAADALGVRDVLLFPYRKQPDEFHLKFPRPMGWKEGPDEMTPLRERVVAAGGPSRYLQNVIRACEELGHMAIGYAQGLYAATTVAFWRVEVNRVYAGITESIDAARAWLAGWQPPSRGPEVIFTEDYREIRCGNVPIARCTDRQATILRALDEERKQGGSGLTRDGLIGALREDGDVLSDEDAMAPVARSFKGHPAWDGGQGSILRSKREGPTSRYYLDLSESAVQELQFAAKRRRSASRGAQRGKPPEPEE